MLKNVVGLRISVIFLVNNVCFVIYNSIFLNMEIYYLIRFCFKKKIYLYNNFLVWEKIKLKMKIKWWVKCDWFLFVRLVRDLKVINRYLDFGFRRLRYV